MSILGKLRGLAAPPPPSPAVAAAMVREDQLAVDESPVAAEYRDWLSAQDAGIAPEVDESPLKTLARIYDALEIELQRVGKEISYWHDARARLGVSGPGYKRLHRLEAKRDELDEAIDKIHPKLHPPAIFGQVDELEALRCRGCGAVTFKTPRERFDAVGRCGECRRRPESPPADSWLDELLERCP